MGKLGRSQDAYDRFSAAVDVPLTVLAVVWLPVLVIPLAVRITPGLIDLLVIAVPILRWNSPSSGTPPALPSTISATRSGGRSPPRPRWGYGDTYPVTAGGRGVAVVLMLTGIGLAAQPGACRKTRVVPDTGWPRPEPAAMRGEW